MYTPLFIAAQRVWLNIHSLALAATTSRNGHINCAWNSTTAWNQRLLSLSVNVADNDWSLPVCLQAAALQVQYSIWYAPISAHLPAKWPLKQLIPCGIMSNGSEKNFRRRIKHFCSLLAECVFVLLLVCTIYIVQCVTFSIISPWYAFILTQNCALFLPLPCWCGTN